MKISPEAVKALQLSRLINPAIKVRAGSRITSNSHKNVVCGIFNVSDVFPTDFSVSDVGQLVSVLSMFKSPDIEFNDSHMIVSGSEGAVRFWYSAANVVGTMNWDKVSQVKVDTSFEIPKEVIKAALAAASVLRLDRVKLWGDGKKSNISVLHESCQSSHSFTKEIGDTSLEFGLFFVVDRLAIMPNDDYTVDIMKQRMARFTSSDKKISFLFTSEQASYFNS